MIIAITYSTNNSPYITMRKRNIKSAYVNGKADIVYEFTPQDIDNEFRQNNKKILSYKRGAGLYLWKPYIIQKALTRINYGDYLIYSDADSIYINPIQYLIDAMELSGQNIMVFDLPLVSKQWTKQETFLRLNCDKSYSEKNQILANFILLKKTDITINFINDYLKNCCDEIALSPTLFNEEIKNINEFIDHREDQSILSILSTKYGLQSFRDPSQFGFRPWEIIEKEEMIYKPLVHDNSNYPAIFLLVGKHFYKNKIKHFFKQFQYEVSSAIGILPIHIRFQLWITFLKIRLKKQLKKAIIKS